MPYPANRHAATEKNAIITLQSILSSRGIVPKERFEQLSYYLSCLPAPRALLIYGHAMHAIASRLDSDDPYQTALKQMGETITQEMGHGFVELTERDANFYQQQKPLLAQNFERLGRVMNKIAKSRG
ncbi:MAG TPA: hypothetical protein VGF14_00660, partial [Alphaproteobacteria bacterium]